MVLPMDGDVVLDVVGELYIDIIAFPSINRRPRKLSIDGHNGLGWAKLCCVRQDYLLAAANINSDFHKQDHNF